MVRNLAAKQDEGHDFDQCCPLCLEEFDLTDRSFHPCRCGYQVCIWCFHNIQDKLNGLCPACRTPYDKQSLTKLDPALLAAAEADLRRKREQQRLDRAMAKAAAVATNATTASVVQTREALSDRSSLQQVRIMQRNLVYVTGLGLSIAKDEVLRKKEHFGRFGRIVKVAINKKQGILTCSAYVTFKRNVDAAGCISHINSLVQEGKTSMRATFGTTKYCSFFLRNVICNNVGCLYLHELARDSDCFTKEDLQLDLQLDEFDMDHTRLETPSPDRQSPSPSEAAPSSPHSKDIEVPVPTDAPIASNSQVVSAPLAIPDSASDSTYAAQVQDVPILIPSHNMSFPAPPAQSRRSFAVDHDSRAAPLLPGISALGLGKSDASPFGWEPVGNPRSITAPKSRSTISPPDSPRTVVRNEQQQMFRSLLPNVDVSFLPQQGQRSQDYNLFSCPAPLSRQPLKNPPPMNPSAQQPMDRMPDHINRAVGVPPSTGMFSGLDNLPPPQWSRQIPPSRPVFQTSPGYEQHYSSERAPRPPPGLSFHSQSQMPPRFDHMSSLQSPPVMMDAPLPVSTRFDQTGIPPSMFDHGLSPPPGDFLARSSQQYRPLSQMSNPGLIQRPTMEPVLHMNGARFNV